MSEEKKTKTKRISKNYRQAKSLNIIINSFLIVTLIVMQNKSFLIKI